MKKLLKVCSLFMITALMMILSSTLFGCNSQPNIVGEYTVEYYSCEYGLTLDDNNNYSMSKSEIRTETVSSGYYTFAPLAQKETDTNVDDMWVISFTDTSTLGRTKNFFGYIDVLHGSTISLYVEDLPETFEKIEKNLLSFKSLPTGVIVSGADRNATNIVIPKNYKGAPVTEIADYAFSNYNSLTSVTIPSSVTKIGKNAFSGCEKLISVSMPDMTNLSTIESSAFDYCVKLQNITIPISVISMGERVFMGCKALTIRCEFASQPSEWSTNWNERAGPIQWGVAAPKLFYIFNSNGGSNVTLQNVAIVESSPITQKEGSLFCGWYDNQDFVGMPVSFPYSGRKGKTNLYAKWRLVDGKSFSTAFHAEATNAVTISAPYEKVYFSFNPSETRDYFIHATVGPDSRVELYNNNEFMIDSDDDHGENKNFFLREKLTAGQIYYIVVYIYGSSTGSFTFTIGN